MRPSSTPLALSSLLFSSLLFSSLLLELILIGCGALTGQTTLPPQTYEATIYRDQLGIGHVWGNYDPDVAYGVGRLVTRDRPLRTYVALTLATGRCAEVFGAVPPFYPPIQHEEGSYWLNIDRMALACEVPQRAQALWNHYCAATDPDSIQIRNLIVAYVEGIKDEIAMNGSPDSFATLYDELSLGDDWPYGNVLKYLSHGQRKRLFERSSDVNGHIIQQWEPFAAILFWLGQVSTIAGAPTESPMDGVAEDLLSKFFQFGSSSWGILDEANGTNGHGFLQADSHNGFAHAHMIRFASRFGNIDCGGATWEGLGPFLFNGAFTKNAAWATLFHGVDDRDVLKFSARQNGSIFEYKDYYQSNDADWTPLITTTLTLNYYDFSLSTLASTQKTVYHLQPGTANPSTLKIWAGWPDNDTWVVNAPTVIRAERMATLDPGLPPDPVLDQPRTLYKMLTAPDAETVTSLLLQSPLGVPLNYMIGSGTAGTLASTQQLISFTAGRAPFRMNEYVDNTPVSTLDWSTHYRNDIDLTEGAPVNHREHRWYDETIQQQQRMFHPASHFPIVRAHDAQNKVYYMSNCNSGQHWIFGRMFAFPDTGTGDYPLLEMAGWVEPRYFVPDELTAYQSNPIVDNWDDYELFLTKRPEFGGFSPSITKAYRDGNPPMCYTWGKFIMRQEWAFNRLSSLFENQSHIITEQNLKDLINDRTDWVAYYLHRIEYDYTPTSLNWFETARNYLDSRNLPNETQLLALMTEFDTWATPSASSPAGSNLAESSLTPVKWVIFWNRFREEGKLTSLTYDYNLYREPFYPYWPDVDNPGGPLGADINSVRARLEEAATYTVERTANLAPTFRVSDMFRVRIPFVDGAECGVTAFRNSNKRVYYATLDWDVAPSSSPGVSPRRRVHLHSFLPLLVRFPRQSLSERTVHLMNYNIVSDQLGLPDWGSPTYLQRYKNSIEFAAAGQMEPLPLTETALVNMNAFSIVVINFTPRSAPRRP